MKSQTRAVPFSQAIEGPRLRGVDGSPPLTLPQGECNRSLVLQAAVILQLRRNERSRWENLTFEVRRTQLDLSQIKPLAGV